MQLKPLQDRIVAKKEQPEKTTKSGILLGVAEEAPAYAVVEALGPGGQNRHPGDKIITKNYSSTDVKLGDTDYIIVKEEDVLATL